LAESTLQPAAPTQTVYQPPAGFERNQLFLAQTAHFLRVASGQENPLCSLQDGIRALDLAMAAKKAIYE